MMTGRGIGIPGRRWRTGSPHSRARPAGGRASQHPRPRPLHRRHLRGRRLCPRDPGGGRLQGAGARPRPERGRANAAGLVDADGRPAHGGGEPLLGARRSRRGSASPPSTASSSTSASPRCSSTRPSAAFRSVSTARSTCAWRRKGRAPPTWWRWQPSARSPTSSSCLARSAIRAPSPAPSSGCAARRRSAPPGSSPRSFRAWCARGRAIFIRRPARSRPCACSSTRSSASSHAALIAAERILRPGGRLVVSKSFHSLEDRIVKTFLAARAGTRAGSRHLPAGRAAAGELRDPDQAPGRPRRCGSRRQPARALRQAARRRAHRGARRQRRSAERCRACRRSPMCMRKG